MIRQLNKISAQMDDMVKEMITSNELMRKLTKQLEIISLPPDLIGMARDIAEVKRRSGT